MLWLGANFLIPLVLSFFLAFAILTTFHFFKDKFQLPNFLVAIITISIFLGIFYIIGHIINNNIVKIVELAPEYEDKIVKIVNGLLGQFGLEQTFSFDNYIKSIDIPTLL